MTNVMILGANGQPARHTTPAFLKRDDVRLTLFLRRAIRLRNPDPACVRVVKGDATDRQAIETAMQGQDVVYANLTGDMARQRARHRRGDAGDRPQAPDLHQLDGPLRRGARRTLSQRT